MTPKRQSRFVAIQNIPSPYRIHLLQTLHRELSARGVQLHVHYMAKGHAERPVAWRDPQIPFPHTYWRDYGWHAHHWNPGMVRTLRQGGPVEYLLVGSAWDTFTGISATLRVGRKKGILWTEGNTKTPGRLDGALGWFKRLILGRYDFVAVPGQEGVGYVALHQQRTARRMPGPVVLPNLIDESRFRVKARWTQREIADTRNRFGVLPSERLALSPARLEPAKGLVEFIEKVPAGVLEGWKWIIVGEGSQKTKLEEVLRSQGWGDRVSLLNYVPYEEMPLLYAASDLFVLPSVYDPNPLSVVEAMHSGLPLLLSNQVGNYPEALLEGATGWGFSPFETGEVRVAVQQAFTASPHQLQRCGVAAKAQAEKVWGSESAIRNFVDALGIPRA